jgi:hypothetical protein
VTSIVLPLLFYSASPVTSQTPTPASATEVVKIDVDLVKIDALVLQKKTARILGGLNKEDFLPTKMESNSRSHTSARINCHGNTAFTHRI